LTFDLDRLLWVPGKKTIFIPSPRVEIPPPSIVGMALNPIDQGNYGFIQIYGWTAPCPAILDPAVGLYEYVQARKPIAAGQVVTLDDIRTEAEESAIVSNTIPLPPMRRQSPPRQSA
jgi:hypothetical protein